MKEILSKVDHTYLAQTATWEDIKEICDEGIMYQVASVCIPPAFVKQAKEYVGEKVKICTVIGFPNGYNTAQVKAFETSDAVNNGADEIDMVVNIGDVKGKKYDKVLEEINLVKKSCQGRLLKVIIETCLLTEEEKIKMCEVVSQSNADYIKTSTGFSSGGATAYDIELMKRHVDDRIKIKAAGGISSILDGEKFLLLGANRLGTSKIVKIIKNNKESR